MHYIVDILISKIFPFQSTNKKFLLSAAYAKTLGGKWGLSNMLVEKLMLKNLTYDIRICVSAHQYFQSHLSVLLG